MQGLDLGDRQNGQARPALRARPARPGAGCAGGLAAPGGRGATRNWLKRRQVKPSWEGERVNE